MTFAILLLFVLLTHPVDCHVFFARLLFALPMFVFSYLPVVLAGVTDRLFRIDEMRTIAASVCYSSPLIAGKLPPVDESNECEADAADVEEGDGEDDDAEDDDAEDADDDSEGTDGDDNLEEDSVEEGEEEADGDDFQDEEVEEEKADKEAESEVCFRLMIEKCAVHDGCVGFCFVCQSAGSESEGEGEHGFSRRDDDHKRTVPREKTAEELQFDHEFQDVMQESLSSRQAMQKVANMPDASTLARVPTTQAVHMESEDGVDVTADDKEKASESYQPDAKKSSMPFRVLWKKNNRIQAREVLVPVDSQLAKLSHRGEQEKHEEQEQIKRYVLASLARSRKAEREHDLAVEESMIDVDFEHRRLGAHPSLTSAAAPVTGVGSTGYPHAKLTMAAAMLLSAPRPEPRRATERDRDRDRDRERERESRPIRGKRIRKPEDFFDIL